MKTLSLKRWMAIFLLILVGTPLLALFVWGGMNYSGFCWEEQRWMSDEEQIDRAIIAVNGRGPNRNATQADGKWHDHGQPVRYETLDAFKLSNPDCCWIAEDDTKALNPSTLYLRVVGWAQNVIGLRYTARWQRKDGSIHVMENFEEHATMPNCPSGRIYTKRID